MLGNRIFKAKLWRISFTIKTTGGCPQSVVLPPLLWYIVIDKILMKLNEAGYIVPGKDNGPAVLLGHYLYLDMDDNIFSD